MDQWTTSVVVGKDAVPRASVNNLSRLMDEMVTALARCRCVHSHAGLASSFWVQADQRWAQALAWHLEAWVAWFTDVCLAYRRCSLWLRPRWQLQSSRPWAGHRCCKHVRPDAAAVMRRYHKLRLLFGAWWNKENRPPPEHLFYPYQRIPKECRQLLERCVLSAHALP